MIFTVQLSLGALLLLVALRLFGAVVLACLRGAIRAAAGVLALTGRGLLRQARRLHQARQQRRIQAAHDRWA